MKKVLTVSIIIIIALALGCAKQNEPADPSQMNAGITFPAKPMQVLMDDCDDNDDVNAWGGYWFTYDDRAVPNYGISIVFPRNGDTFTMSYVGPDYPGDNLYAARVHGTVLTGPDPCDWDEDWPDDCDFPYPLIGVGTGLSPNDIPQDLTGFTGMKFWFKRAGVDDSTLPDTGVDDSDYISRFSISLKHANITDSAVQSAYGVTFSAVAADTWQEYDFKFEVNSQFAGFTQADWSCDPLAGPPVIAGCLDKTDSFRQIQGIQVQTANDDPTAGIQKTMQVDFWIDNIVLYRD